MDDLLQQLIIPIKEKNIHKQIIERIGSLSRPEKMPGYAWNISAKYCITGSFLQKIDNTPCSKCYALRGRYNFARAKNAMDKRLQGWHKDPDWVLLMAIRLLLYQEKYFRWFDSGDLQSEKMLLDINNVAKLTPNISHWLPTQERVFVRKLKGNISSNLNIRISSPLIGKCYMLEDLNTSSVAKKDDFSKYSKDSFLCNSINNNGKCGTCRACWDNQIKHIVYFLH